MLPTSSLIVPSENGPAAEISRKKLASHWKTPAYEQHLKDFMPTAEDKVLLLDIINNEKKWIAVKEGARDPLSSIGEVRKSAINL